MRKLTSIFCLSIFPLFLSGQIHLINPSFEGDEPQDAVVPAGWHACKMGTTPDILPGIWGVYNEASEGETFVGLITRADGTWESIGQRLPSPIFPNECYAIALDLAHSKSYAGYNKPIRLRIWGGKSKCAKDQLLVESKFIEHTDWETYSFQFVPKEPLYYIVLEANFTDGSDFSHQGNIMIDNLRPIKTCARASLLP